MTKCCVTDAPLKREGRTRVRDEMIYKSMWGTGLPSENLQASIDTYTETEISVKRYMNRGMDVAI